MGLILKPFSPTDFANGNLIGIDWAVEYNTFMRRPAQFVRDVSQNGLCDSLLNLQHVRRTPVYCMRASDATLVGYRAVVTSDKQILLDEYLTSQEECDRQIARFLDRSSPLMHEDSEFVQLGADLHSEKLTKESAIVTDPTVLLASIEPSNYGSWIFRILPKLITAKICGLMHMKFAVWCPMKWQKDLLKLYGLEEHQIIPLDFSKPHRFKSLFIPSLRNPECFLDGATLGFYDDFLKRLGISRGGKQRIYVSRRHLASNPDGTRRFKSEAQFEDLLKGSGFQIVAPDKLPMMDQIKLFASSEIVVGSSGSGLFNAVYMTPGAHLVDIEAFPHWLHAHANLFSSCGLSYGFITGEPDPTDPVPVHKSWDVDVVAAANAVEVLCNFVDERRR